MENQETMRIYLIGYSYSGKTTMGRQLAKLLGFRFFDTDKEIENKYHTTIPLIFERYGEKAFRIIESSILHSTHTIDDVVVSTGGGTPCNEENIRFILNNGIAIYLEMSVDEIIQRAVNSHKQRPLLHGMTESERRQYIERHLSQRIPYYKQAHIVLSGVTVTADQIIQHLK